MSPLANMLIQIKNAQIRGLEEVLVPASSMKRAIAMILQKEGYLAKVEDIKKKGKKSELPYLSITLKPEAIHDVALISKPSRRMYAGKADMGKIKNGFGKEKDPAQGLDGCFLNGDDLQQAVLHRMIKEVHPQEAVRPPGKSREPLHRKSGSIGGKDRFFIATLFQPAEELSLGRFLFIDGFQDQVAVLDRGRLRREPDA